MIARFTVGLLFAPLALGLVFAPMVAAEEAQICSWLQSAETGSTRARMERGVRPSFEDVRVHDDAGATQSAHRLNADAFTLGRPEPPSKKV